MKLTMTLLRTGSAVAATGLLVGMLSACAPASKPAPKPTTSAAFATDEEAFAAAEATYRVYVDALNASDLNDAYTFEPVYAILTGTALESERESLSKYHAADLTRFGESDFDSFAPLTVTEDTITANLCIDVSQVDLQYADGTSALPPDRITRDGRKVTFVHGSSRTGLLIASNHAPEGDFTCQ